MNPNFFDLAAVLLLVIGLLVGYRSGAFPQVGGLAGAIAGGALAILSLPLLEDVLATIDPFIRALLVVVGLLVAIGIGEGVGSGAGRAVRASLGRVVGQVDRVAGAAVGVAQAIFIIWLAGGLLAAGPLPRLGQQAQTSVTVRALDAVLPPPTELADELARILDATGLPDVFIGLEPLPGAPVDVPDDPTVQAIAQRAQGSQLRVTAQTCGRISTGSSFAIARGYVVTNAHVIAGATTIRLNLGNATFDATAVLFDPQLDLAVLHAPRLDVPALRFASADPTRGGTGAVLGFPGGGGLRIVPAAITGRYDAQGRDIYGRARVTRSILEIRADIARGNSGGPLVLVDGTVGGVVFAESRTSPDVGYALSPTTVAVRTAPALGRTSSVDTGDCIR
jgi:S1-C subfamily serine protease